MVALKPEKVYVNYSMKGELIEMSGGMDVKDNQKFSNACD